MDEIDSVSDSCGLAVHFKYLLRREHLMSLLSFSVIISKYMARAIVAISSYPWIIFETSSFLLPFAIFTKSKSDKIT